jgi:2-polyprenyl-3-methyl-5-hydroxy-6-metoxy-1,4-benzoquinol methylase
MSVQIEINKIMKMHMYGKTIVYNIPNNVDKYQLFIGLISETNSVPIKNNNSTNINFKMKYYYNIFEFVVTEMNKVYNKQSDIKIIDSFDYIIKSLLLAKLSVLSKGQILLNKISHRINKFILSDNNILVYLRESSRIGTFMNFLFWLNKTSYKTINKLPVEEQEKIFIFSIGNSDDRLFKFILKKIVINDKLVFQKNTFLIKELIQSLGFSLIPPKYILKRIKILSEYISLVPYFKVMVNSFNSEKIILELHKHYYVIPHDFNSINQILSTLIFINWGDEFVISDNFKLFIKKLLTIEEKVMVNIIMAILFDTYQTKFYMKKQPNIDNIVNANYVKIIQMISWDDISFSNKLLNHVIFSLSSQKLINKYYLNFDRYINIRIILYTRFLPVYFYTKQKNLLISVNLLLHKLRLYIKTKCKIRLIQHKVKIFDLLREIKYFNPKKNISILKHGSYQYQTQKQKFSNLPPRHLLPGEINIYNNYLLREKADGILINNIPIGIYPHVQILNNYQVKAEYIEEIDLYLIFDIDIPNTTIEERYDILRKNHPLTCNTSMQNINSIDDFIKIFKYEREIIKQFLIDNNSEPIKWFPKFACKYDFNNVDKLNIELNIELIQKIILAQDKEIYEIITNSKPYSCDGLILTPLNGTREIKIKPQSMMTIDLLFNNNKWLDRNNNDWSHIINSTKQRKEGRIYRCYPNDTFNKFNVGEYRYDKKKPNPYNIVDTIIVIVKYNWLQDFNQMKTYYYDSSKKITLQEIINTIKTQYDNLVTEIVNVSPELNKLWLDLGCGYGKLIPIIKKYNPKKYLGMDADINQLIRALQYTDINPDIYTFNPCNLDKYWNDTLIKWNSLNKKIKYDYIIANFSLMHFCTDAFWLQLNEIVHSETIFIFNLVALPDNTENEWKLHNSYLKIKDNKTIYKFEWIHDEEKIEPFISDKEINEYIKKYNWKVLKNHSFNSKHSLVNFYKWWVLSYSK